VGTSFHRMIFIKVSIETTEYCCRVRWQFCEAFCSVRVHSWQCCLITWRTFSLLFLLLQNCRNI